MKVSGYLVIMVGILSVLLTILVNRYSKLEVKYSTSVENYKAYEAELNDETRVFKLSIDELSISKDSIVNLLNKTRKEMSIKDKKIKQLQYNKTTIVKGDTVLLRDTIFRLPSFSLDTIIGDRWVQTELKLKYPNLISIKPKVELESFTFISAKRETIKPRKKFFIARWFQKKHTVVEVQIKENNPYVINKTQKFIEIIK